MTDRIGDNNDAYAIERTVRDGYEPPRMPQLLQPKQQLAGYEIDELVGKGGMGEVYRARQISMDRVVALKILAPRLAKQDPIFAKRFVDEARAAGRLNHPNIIAVHDVGKAPLPHSEGEPDLDYFSMEYVDGESVKEVIDRQGVVPLSLVGQVMQGMSEALVYAESQGIVHRDIKPDNIMITNGGMVKLADLGLALQLGGEEIVAEKDDKGRGKVMGTPLYMSPEQARALSVDSRSDQYSLGATLFHMLTGKPPFKGESSKVIMRAHVFDPVPDPKAINHDVPEAWRQLCMRLMAKNPEERFPTCQAMRAAVVSAMSGHHHAPANSRRVRTTPIGSSHKHHEAMPSWAKYMIYAFGASVVLMVIILSIPMGGSSQTKPAQDPGQEKPPLGIDVDAEQLERVIREIARLPSDHKKAVQILTRLVDDKSLTSVDARERAQKELKLRRDMRNDQIRKEKEAEKRARDKLIREKDLELERALFEADLVRAKACVDYLTDQQAHLDAATQKRLDGFTAQLRNQQEKLTRDLTEEIVLAKSMDELVGLQRKVESSPLEDEMLSRLKEVADRQGKKLRATKPEVPVEPEISDDGIWKKLSEQIEPYRGDLNYIEIAKVAEQLASKASNSELKDRIAGISTLSELARTTETHLRNYVAQSTPDGVIFVGGDRTKVKFTQIDKQIAFVDKGETTIVDRRMIKPDYEPLVRDALKAANVPEGDRTPMLAAFLWVWKIPSAANVFASIPNHPIAQSFKEYERHKKGLNIEAAIINEGMQSKVMYGIEPHPWIVEDFSGDNIIKKENTIIWSSDKVVNTRAGLRNENEIPTITWNGAFKPPFTMRVKLRMSGNTQLLLFGVKAGARRVRLGLGNIKFPHQVLALVSELNGPGFEIAPGSTEDTVKLEAGNIVEVALKVDESYKVTMSYNGQQMRYADILPKDEPITPIIQAVNIAEGQSTTVELINAIFSGTPVSP